MTQIYADGMGPNVCNQRDNRERYLHLCNPGHLWAAPLCGRLRDRRLCSQKLEPALSLSKGPFNALASLPPWCSDVSPSRDTDGRSLSLSKAHPEPVEGPFAGLKKFDSSHLLKMTIFRGMV